MTVDPGDPHGLLKTLVAHGVVVTLLAGRDWYTATCPFGTHPDRVNTGAGSVPVFELRASRGTWRCIECGDGGDVPALTARLAERIRA